MYALSTARKYKRDRKEGQGSALCFLLCSLPKLEVGGGLLSVMSNCYINLKEKS